MSRISNNVDRGKSNACEMAHIVAMQNYSWSISLCSGLAFQWNCNFISIQHSACLGAQRLINLNSASFRGPH